MAFRPTRREWLAGVLSAAAANAAPRPAGLLIDTHIHLFAGDPKAFPYHPNAPYRPEAQTLEDYSVFVRKAKIDHSVIVHPEPYQDDHRYLEYCFEREPSPGFFKGTCLFDPLAADTPERMRALTKKHPKRIVALRIHQMREAGRPPARTGPIKERDLAAPEMANAWKEAASLGLAIQMHFVPAHAGGIHALASRFPGVKVVLDHLGRPGQGTPGEYEDVLRLAKLPNTHMKLSGWRYASKQDPPHADLKPLVRRIYDAFGPRRILWGGLGMNMTDFEQNVATLAALFDFANESERALIRGTNAARLFGFM
jgi:predicted TIM-barrel fold metal-dependent hydrolase